MAASVQRLNEREGLWQGVARWFRPLPSPWAAYVADEDVGKLILMVLAVNMRPMVAEISIHNPYTLSTFTGGFELVIPDDLTRTSFPAGVSMAEARKNLGLDDSGRTPDYTEATAVLAWTDKTIRELAEQRMLFSQTVRG